MTDGLATFSGAAEPPRANGELVFDEPWQMRAFGVAADLVEQGRCTWDDFRKQLIEAIGQWERTPVDRRGEWSYYEHWLTALEVVVDAHTPVGGGDVERRAVEYSQRPHGHDH